ncbi:hypothetical protein B0A52_01086 [Exophiala mesophila]|uniref:J domain-containing protein n=1 Tax=Exophiala mesophila TaxID=212818 RepID=A0A438NGF5_EXOME|nr:hypothetical protein B0A52_01086 [Exophiala mesophila]
MPCHYSVLGVSKASSNDEIKAAYRALVLTAHPDKGGDQAKFQEIQGAWETLRDPTKRQEYDRAQERQAQQDTERDQASRHRSHTHTYTRTYRHDRKNHDRPSRERREHAEAGGEKPRSKDDDDHVKTKTKTKTSPTTHHRKAKDDFWSKDDFWAKDDFWRRESSTQPGVRVSRHEFYYEYDSSKNKAHATRGGQDQPQATRQGEPRRSPVVTGERNKQPNRAPEADKSPSSHPYKVFTDDLENLRSEANTRLEGFDKGMEKMKEAVPKGTLHDRDLQLLNHVHKHLEKTVSCLTEAIADFSRLEAQPGNSHNQIRNYEKVKSRAKCDKAFVYDCGQLCVKVHKAGMELADRAAKLAILHLKPEEEIVLLDIAVAKLHSFLMANLGPLTYSKYR